MEQNEIQASLEAPHGAVGSAVHSCMEVKSSGKPGDLELPVRLPPSPPPPSLGRHFSRSFQAEGSHGDLARAENPPLEHESAP